MEEVVQRKAKMGMNRFKTRSMDEKVETIEKLTQEALRVCEEIRTTETTKAQRRGLILLEGA
jgi:hypothetical protein